MARPGTVDYGKWEKMAAEMSDDEEAEEAADEERRRSAQLAREQRSHLAPGHIVPLRGAWSSRLAPETWRKVRV